MQAISKPHLVDLLRIFDKNRWVTPRIRYASVRSKPELIKDLRKVFPTYHRDNRIYFKLRKLKVKSHSMIPIIIYDLDQRTFLFNGLQRDVPSESLKKVKFTLRPGPITIYFDLRDECGERPARASPRLSGRASFPARTERSGVGSEP